VVDPKLPEPVLLYLPSDVLFDYGSSKLREEAFPLLQQTASMIGQYSRAKIQISGHTDSFGSDSFNQRLSEARAQVVEDFLRKTLPQPVYTFNVSGYGKTKPIVSPTLSREEQQRNRRVEVVIQAIPQ
jgi:outer membrane protein OmpA-like peptidoglycan-associated protein